MKIYWVFDLFQSKKDLWQKNESQKNNSESISVFKIFLDSIESRFPVNIEFGLLDRIGL